MSSAPSGRYQSRFFNFVARRSRQFADKLDQTIRQMKVATVWGAQILLYPFYALFQTSRLVGRQLQTSVADHLPRLMGFKQGDQSGGIPKVDRPVQKVLEAIATWELPAITAPLALEHAALEGELAIWSAASDLAISASIPLAVGEQNGTPVATAKPAIAIQGVASLLETHSLVLVTTQNQILNVLTPAQQQQLHHRIIWEVSDYQRSLRLATRRPWRSLVGSQPKNPQILPPVRWLYRLMAWVQTSPVAIAANLFQESTLAVPSRPALPHSNFAAQPQRQSTSFDFAPRSRQFAAGIVPLPPLSYSTLAPLDRAIAELETHPWLPTLAALPTAIAQRVQGLVQQWQQQLATTDTNDLANGPNSPTQQSLNGIQTLIRAAVNYFFFRQHPQALVGDETDLEPESTLPSPSPFYKVGGRSDRQLPSHNPLDPDQWLTFGDLFDNPILMDQGEDFDGGSVADPDKLALASSTVVVSFSGRASGWLSVFPGGAIAHLVGKAQFWARAIVRKNSSGVAQQAQWGKASTIALPETVPGTTPATSPDSSLGPTTRSANQINTTWIETEATTVGYVKHPLERVLEWLDRVMLWLEECAVQIGQWLQQLWHR